MSGVAVQVTNTLDETEVAIVGTDVNGNYALPGLCPGTYSVTPSLPGYQFDQAMISVTVGPDADGVNFTAVYAISGQITNGSGGLSGVNVTMSGPVTNAVSTGADGRYTNWLPAGAYTVTPQKACYSFGPANYAVAIGPGTNGLDFSASGGVAYTISGWLTNAPAGVTVLATNNGGSFTATNDATGYYVISNCCPGTYLVRPSSPGYLFSPATNSITVVSNISGVNFTALTAFNVSGQILEGTNGLAGVSVTMAGPVTNMVVTDANGNYTNPLPAGTYTVTPSLPPCYRFNPANRTVIDTNGVAGVNFIAGRLAYTISGQITAGTNAFSGAAVQATNNTGSFTATSDAGGNYVITNCCPGTYWVTPSLPGYLFNPAANSITVGPANANGVNFTTLATFSVSGRVLYGANGLAGVNVAVGTSNTVTDANGNYTVTNLQANTYPITPSLACYSFNPANRTVVAWPSTNGVNFAASNDVYTISGRIAEGADGLSGVAVEVRNPTNATDITIGTDVNGNYALAGLCPGIYSVTPSLPGYVFDPVAPTITVGPSANGVNFAAARFRIGAITLSANGTFQISVPTNPGATTYWLEASTNLNDPSSWEAIFTTNLPFQFTDGMTNSLRFYRAGVQ